MACFWTDFVGCAEDCPADRGPAVLMGLGAAMGSGSSGSGYALPYFPDTGEHVAGTLQFDTVTVYHCADDDFGGCSWRGFLATTDSALAGTTDDDVYSPTGDSGYTLTWKLLSEFDFVEAASGSNVALSPDGQGGSVISSADLFSAIGYSNYDNTGFVIMATLRDVDANVTYEASWVLDTCF